jgi:hypothetical protein
MTRRGWLAVACLGMLALVVAGVVEACPMCRDALADPAQGGQAARVAKGFALSIATMAGMPFLLVGTVAFFLVRAARRSKLLRASAPRPSDGS